MLANRLHTIEDCDPSVLKLLQEGYYGEFDYRKATFPEYVPIGDFLQVWQGLQCLVESLLAKFFSREDLYPEFSAFLGLLSNGAPAGVPQIGSLTPGTPKERNEIGTILTGHIEDAIKPPLELDAMSEGPKLQGKVEAGKVCVQVAVRIVYRKPGNHATIITVDICSDKQMTAVEAESFLQNQGNWPAYRKIDNNDADASTLCSSTGTLEKGKDGVSTTGSYSSHELGDMEIETKKSISASIGLKRSRLWASTAAVTRALTSCFTIGPSEASRLSSSGGEVA